MKATEGSVGHGRNDLALGPDGMTYAIYGNNVLAPEDDRPSRSPLRNWGEDQLLPCSWDQRTSPVSPMPTGLLNTLSKDDILDLLTFLIADWQIRPSLLCTFGPLSRVRKMASASGHAGANFARSPRKILTKP